MLRAALRHAVIAADPQGAEERCKEAERRAKVVLYPDEENTATLAGQRLPTVHAAAAMARIRAMARALKASGAGGGMDLLCAQVYVGLLLGTLPLIPPAKGAPPDDPPGPDPSGPPNGSAPPRPPGDAPGQGPSRGPGQSPPCEPGSPGAGPAEPSGGNDHDHDHGAGRAERPGGHRDGGQSPGAHEGAGSGRGAAPPGESPIGEGPRDRSPASGTPPGDDPPASDNPPSADDSPPHEMPPGQDPPPAEDVPPPGDADAPRDEDDYPSAGDGRVPAGWVLPGQDDDDDHWPAADWPGLPAVIPPAFTRPGAAADSASTADAQPAGDRARPGGGRSGLLDVSLPWQVLAGISAGPGHLGRIGPVTATQARRIAECAAGDPGAEWRIIVTTSEGKALAVSRIPRRRVSLPGPGSGIGAAAGTGDGARNRPGQPSHADHS